MVGCCDDECKGGKVGEKREGTLAGRRRVGIGGETTRGGLEELVGRGFRRKSARLMLSCEGREEPTKEGRVQRSTSSFLERVQGLCGHRKVPFGCVRMVRVKGGKTLRRRLIVGAPRRVDRRTVMQY